LLGRPLAIVFADLVILFEPLEHVKAVTPHVPHGDLAASAYLCAT